MRLLRQVMPFLRTGQRHLTRSHLRGRTHHTKERPPQRLPKVRAPILISLPTRTILPRPLPLNRSEEVLGRLVVAADIEAAHAEVVRRAGEGRAQVQSASVSGDGFFRLAAVGERRAEAVPEEEVLRRGISTCGSEEEGGERTFGRTVKAASKQSFALAYSLFE